MTHEFDSAWVERTLSESDGDLVLAAGLLLAEPATVDDVAAVVTRWIDTHPEHARLFDTGSAAEARLIASLAQALVADARIAAGELSGDTPPPEALSEARQRIAILTMPQG